MLSKIQSEQTTGAIDRQYLIQANKKIINRNDK